MKILDVIIALSFIILFLILFIFTLGAFGILIWATIIIIIIVYKISKKKKKSRK